MAPRDGQSAYVAVTLTSDGARRFEEATGRLVRRRIAILTSGVVRSVPIVQSKIGGGHVSITVGHGSPEKQYKEAKQLAADLGGK